MQMMLLVMRTPEFSQKGRGIQPEHIEGGQQGRKHAHHIINRTLAKGPRQYLVLGEKAGERRDPRNGDTAYQECQMRRRHILLQSTHLTHVLLATHGMDDGTGPQKE